MAPSASSIPSEPLPFAADTLSHNRWRRHQILPSGSYTGDPNQTFEAFLAAAIAEDTLGGVASKPIAPSIISELSTSHKKLIRRYRRLYWILLVLGLAAMYSSVIAVVLLVQDAVTGRGTRAVYLIWFLLSFTTFAVLGTGLAVVGMSRARRRRWEEERGDREVEKWKREARRMAREMVVLRMQAGRLGQSLRDVSRGASRAGTARSVSRGRRRKRGSIAEDKELPALPGNLEHANRASTWTHHLDLEPDQDDYDERNQNDPTNKLALTTHLATPGGTPPLLPPKPTHKPLPPHLSPSPYLFLRPSFPSFHPSTIDPTPSRQSDENFLAANTAASDAVSDNSIVAARRRVMSAERVTAWRDGREAEKKKERLVRSSLR